MKRLLSWLSVYGCISRRAYWLQTTACTLVLSLGLAMAMLSKCLLAGLPAPDWQRFGILPAMAAVLLSFASPLCFLCAAPILVHMMDNQGSLMDAGAALAGWEPQLVATMLLGGLLALAAAWRAFALSARRLRDAGKSRVYLLLTFCITPLLMMPDGILGTLALLFCWGWLLSLTTRPGKAEGHQPGKAD